MPAGAHWTLRYEPTVDDRIQCCVDTQRLRQDEFVLSVERVHRRYRDPILLEIQFGEDRDGPYDSRITSEIGDCRRVLPPSPPEPEQPRRGFREILSDFIRSPRSRSELSQAMAAPLRARLDYTSSARRTLITELPGIEHTYSEVTPLDQGQIGSTVQQGIAHLSALGRQIGFQGAVGVQGYQGAVGVQGPIGWQGSQGTRLRKEDIPEWLKPGVWAKRGNFDIYVEVESIDSNLALWEPTIRLKFWRSNTTPQNTGLRDFIRDFAQCEKPTDPPSRYKRIIKGI